MNRVALAIILALFWASITGNFSVPNFILGGGVSVLALWLVRTEVSSPYYFRKFRLALSLMFLFFYELSLSAVRVSILVLSPNIKSKVKPGIIAFPLTVQSDVQITLLANLITLTPGTLSVDVSADKSTLYVHAISVPDKQALIDEIARGFEAKIMEVFE